MKIRLTLFLLIFQLHLFGQYQIYSDLTNLFSQKLIETRDGGLLLLAGEDCYTPGSVTIEGCMYALHLVRTNAIGDTLWTKRIGFSGSVNRIIENADGSFSLFCIVNDNFECEDVFVGLFGFYAIRIINLTSSGEVENTAQFPGTCELVLRDVTPLNDSLFAALAIFSKPIFWPDQSEGRLMILNKEGEIFREIILPGEDWARGRFLPAGLDTVEMLYIDTSNVFHLTQYDMELNEISHITNVEVDESCFEKASNRISRFKTDNADIIVTCHEKVGSSYYFHVLRFNNELALQTATNNTFNAITNMVEMPNGNFLVCASGVDDPVSHLNTTLVYLNTTGVPYSVRTIEYPEVERPTQILLTTKDSIVVAGNINCCNMHDTIGPGKSFLLFGDFLTTSIKDQVTGQSLLVFPNPANQELFVLANREDSVRPDQLLLFDPIGRMVLRQEILDISESINISGMTGGLYFYLLLKDNAQLASGKLVKF